MSLIGLDFGSHYASVALWFQDKNVIEVIADDLGSRTIPCAVAFRDDVEIITGQAAAAQKYKNIQNTFDDVRALLLSDQSSIFIPALDKEVSVEEVCSHFFRNIHNQVKQYVGKPVRDCVLSVPCGLDEKYRVRILDAARAGGLRIKSFVEDPVSSLLCYEIDNDDASRISLPSNVLALDIGWCKTEISIWNSVGGLLSPLVVPTVSKDVCGSLFVKLLTDYCAKEFQKKTKTSCSDSVKAMSRLTRECEIAVKSLSSNGEVTVGIDSLFEGFDFSVRISRARLEDLSLKLYLNLRMELTNTLTKVNLNPDDIKLICLSGGLSAMPKILVTLKALFPNSEIVKASVDSSEVQCYGAALQGKYLAERGMLELPSPNADSLQVKCTTVAIYASTTTTSTDNFVLIPKGAPLPLTNVALPVQLGSSKGYVKVVAGEGADAALIGEFLVEASHDSVFPLDVSLQASLTDKEGLRVSVVSSNGAILGSLISNS